MEEVTKKRARDEKETETEVEEIDSPEVKRLREDLLDGIDEDSDLCTSIHDLDSFMKSFEEEITASPASGHGSGAAEEGIVESASDCGESGGVEEGIVELASDSSESRPDLGYLLEASDDELRIPPPADDLRSLPTVIEEWPFVGPSVHNFVVIQLQRHTLLVHGGARHLLLLHLPLHHLRVPHPLLLA